MAPVARRIPAPPRALELARRLRDRPGLVVLGPGFGGGARFVACDPIAESAALDPDPDLALDPQGGPLGAAPRWIGLLPYEACRALERRPGNSMDGRPEPIFRQRRWLRYGAVAVISDQVLVVGDDSASVDHLSRLLTRPAVVSAARARLVGVEASARHAARLRAALEHIAAGDVYQVNLARRFELEIEGTMLELGATLERVAPAPFSFCLDLGEVGCTGTSPELFLRTSPDGRVSTEPIKGTRPRGDDANDDRAQARALETDPKERAELVMVIDLERNDLGRVAVPGTVRLLSPPQVHTRATVHHRSALVGARLRSGVDRGALLDAMLPSGSVTGAPKRRAMELIAELEAHRRGLYTGAYGVLHRDGSLTLGMAIRTLERRGREGHYFAGGGIVADSEIDSELLETAWKARQLAALWGDTDPGGHGAGPGSGRRKLVRFLPES